MAKSEEQYNAWLAKQAAMGRKIGGNVSVGGAQYPTVVSYKGKSGTGKTVILEEPGTFMGHSVSELLGDSE